MVLNVDGVANSSFPERIPNESETGIRPGFGRHFRLFAATPRPVSFAGLRKTGLRGIRCNPGREKPFMAFTFS
jgi:hypothetical protein